MEPLFENKYSWTRKMLREMNYRVYRPWLIVIGTIAALMLALLVFASVKTSTPFVQYLSLPVVIFFVIAVLYMFLPLYSAVMTYSRMAKLYESAPDVTVRFFEDRFIDFTRQSDAKLDLQYAQITKVMETNSLLLVKLKGRFVIMIDKNGFTRGSADGLRVFLREKMRSR